MQPQVKKEFYFQKRYNGLNRFISYYYQIDLVTGIIESKRTKILEIGAGSRVVADYFKRMGLNILTCDIDEELKPDCVADIRSLPFGDNSFDVVLAFEVLEHMPFDDFQKSLKDLKRISRKYIIISLPYRSACFELIIKFPFIRTVIDKPFINLFLRIPLSFPFGISKQHYWEIDSNKFSLKKVRNILKKDFRIVKEFRPALNHHQYFFVLCLKSY